MIDGISPELVEAARGVIDANREAGRTIAVAESCTGGLVCAALTAVPGSSAAFVAGYVSYSNDIKQSQLGVPSDTLETFGAVSIATAWQMAQGALLRSGADVAVAVTGIAGPDGGTDHKPVGSVVFARARKGEALEDGISQSRQFGDIGRGAIRVQAALAALELLLP